MVILKNASEMDLQLVRIEVAYSAFTAEFEATNIPAGESVVLLERGRRELPDGEYLSVVCKNVVFFPENLSMHEDMIRIDGENGIMEVTNISNQDIDGDIFIYYKNSAVDLFYGGITYRVRIEGGLAAGESARIISAHYLPKSCRIVGIMWDVQ
jgi:phosphatidylserine/phosphatidylglycerophosphate/cardiolipin synthase-like enzyme